MSLDLETIRRDLQEIGLGAGDVVEVHSSLRRVGRVKGGAQTLVEALLTQAGTNGTIVMSAYPLSPPMEVTDDERGRGIAWKVRRLSEDSTEPTGMGAVSDAFRARKDVVCGLGTHRVCAWGRDRARYAEGYGPLLDSRGLALLIGVGIDRCSSLHLAERTVITAEARAKMDALWTARDAPQISDEVKSQYPDDVSLGGPEGWIDGQPWTNALEEAQRRSLVRHGQVGAADSLVFVVADLVEILETIHLQGPFPHG